MAMESDGTAARGRVREADLPAGLTHGASREFLVTEGLPEKAAFLDFAGPGAGLLEALDGRERCGAGPLFVLGETQYCGSRVVLDGVTGEVHLAARADGEVRRDLLASDLPALAGLIRETEAVAGAAGQPEAGNGHRGAAVAAAVAGIAERRMREIDPGLFGQAAQNPPAHWGTALLVASLAWGALPGTEASGLAYECGADLVEEIAALTDEGRVRRYRPEELPAVLSHGPTRRLLTEVGLPLGGEMFGVEVDEPLVTMAQAHPESFGSGDEAEEGRGYQRDYVAIGWWPHDLAVALDGATGRLELPDWYDEGGPAAYLHQDLSALLYALWTYERLRAAWQDVDDARRAGAWEVFDPHVLLISVVDGLVEAVDPEAFATAGHSWRMLAEDGHTGGLLA
ncbi:SUKH-4 family immunity protein [Streptomyces sp. NBC_00316]|uniref:SUKH-4 family immunity protein n=1 Tax=Streptomyces sp. NBC_00316 TaxID=2975710 RepID=UPI002E28A00A|nr:SUKH-4 family immunity protein [Streptomyces sp. NBC_00316]